MNRTQKKKPFLSPTHVAEILGESSEQAWAREKCADSQIQAYKFGFRRCIDPDELDTWLSQHRTESSSPPVVSALPPNFRWARERSGLLYDLIPRGAEES